MKERIHAAYPSISSQYSLPAKMFKIEFLLLSKAKQYELFLIASSGDNGIFSISESINLSRYSAKSLNFGIKSASFSLHLLFFFIECSNALNSSFDSHFTQAPQSSQYKTSIIAFYFCMERYATTLFTTILIHHLSPSHSKVGFHS